MDYYSASPKIYTLFAPDHLSQNSTDTRGLLLWLIELGILILIYAYHCLNPASNVSTFACLFMYNPVNYCKRGKIHWAKLPRFQEHHESFSMNISTTPQ